jgi:hypothetical protein
MVQLENIRMHRQIPGTCNNSNNSSINNNNVSSINDNSISTPPQLKHCGVFKAKDQHKSKVKEINKSIK